MDLASGQGERSFDMPLSDLGEPDDLLPNICFSFFFAKVPLPPRLAKWIVQKAPGGPRKLEAMPLEDGGFYISVEGHVSEAHAADVHFTGKSLDGTVFASTKENAIPLTFKLTKEDVMEGFRFAITSMQAGEKAVFTIPSEWEVTKSGCPANIPWNVPPNQTLRFDIELISLITDILNDQGIMKKTIKFGTGKELPPDQDEVFVKYNACLEDGASILKSEGVEFSLADGFFCPAFAHVVKTMTKGEEAIVIIKPEYAFGEQGRHSTGNEVAVPPNATLHVHLQLISWKKVTHIGESRDIVKKTLCEVKTWQAKRPRNGAVVKVRLIGKLQDGTVFYRRGHDGDEPFEFTIDEEHVVYGLDEAVMTMMKGEVASFTIPPQHAFGAVGSSQYQLAVIPPNSVVTYEIELLSFVNEEPEFRYWTIPDETVIAVARKKEHEGDDLFNLGKYLRAYRKYFRARQILLSREYVIGILKENRIPLAFGSDESAVQLQSCEQAFDDIKEILISLALKSAECAMQLQRYEQASDRYHEVLQYDPGNPKALEMVAQSFPEAPVAIDTGAMHRGLEEKLVRRPRLRVYYHAGSIRRVKKDRHEVGESMIFVPRDATPDATASHQPVSAAQTTTAGQSPVTPAALPAGSGNSSTVTATENQQQSSGAARGRKRSCFGFSSSN